jgi:predicted ATPase/DNA-binding CsgD family transcriptional regulator
MTAARPSTTLPARLDSFVGRERELADTTRLLGESRLLTLVGPGGAGKTRLALRLAEQLAGSGLPTVTLVDLSSAVDGRNDPVQLTAAALGIHNETGHSLCETVIGAIADRHGLLLFDNCEPVIADAADLLDTLLSRCPGIRVLATSQEAVGIPGEVAYPVGGLDLAAADPGESAAATLFVERAREVNPSFVGNEDVAEICRRLDGLPLYLELAARWVNLLDTAEILERLDDRFALLTASARTATQRHSSLRAVIEWSYQLLDAREQEVFRQLSALPGGFELDDAMAACGDSFQPDEVLHLIHQLQSKSLVVRREAAAGTAPLRILESIRMFGAERLADSGELEACHDRLLDHYSQLCDDAGRVTFRPVRISLRLKDQRDNLAAAVAWAVARRDDRAMLLASGLITSWNLVGWHDRGPALIASLEASLPMTPAQRYIAAHLSSWLAIELRDFATAERDAKVVLELAPAVDLPLQRLSALNALYWVAEEADDVAAQLGYATDAVTLAAELHDPGGLAGHQAALAWALWRSGKRAPAARLLDGIVPVLRQDPSRANLLRVVLTLRGVMAAMGGDLDTAETLFRTESLAAGDADLENLRYGLSGLAVVAAGRGEFERALRLAAAESSLVARTMVRFTWIRTVEDAVARCRAALGPELADRAWAEGSLLSRADAIAYGRDNSWPEQPPAEVESPLSDRELEIAELVAEGLTNRQVATRLTLSPRTIESHLEHIRAKLGLRSRAHIAAWSAAQQA